MTGLFYNATIQRLLSRMYRSIPDGVRSEMFPALGEGMLEFPLRYTNRSIEGLILSHAASKLLNQPFDKRCTLARLDNRKYKKGVPDVADFIDAAVQAYLSSSLTNIEDVLDNTILFPFGDKAKDPNADTTRMSEKELAAYNAAPDNLVTFAEVWQWSLVNEMPFVILYDLCYEPDGVDDNINLYRRLRIELSEGQRHRLKCRVFVASKSYDAVAWMENHYQDLVLEVYSKPIEKLTPYNDKYVAMWVSAQMYDLD